MRGWAYEASAVVALAGLAAWLARRCERIVVAGTSMRPTLEAGDRLLAWRTRRVEPGWLVVVADPRAPERPLVKRAARVDGARVELRGDHAAASTDSRAFGWVERGRVQGRALYRYAPAARAGRLW